MVVFSQMKYILYAHTQPQVQRITRALKILKIVQTIILSTIVSSAGLVRFHHCGSCCCALRGDHSNQSHTFLTT